MEFKLKKKKGDKNVDSYFFIKNEKYSYKFLIEYMDYYIEKCRELYYDNKINDWSVKYILESYITKSNDNKWFAFKIASPYRMLLSPNNTLRELTDFFKIKISKIYIRPDCIQCLFYLKNTIYGINIFPYSYNKNVFSIRIYSFHNNSTEYTMYTAKIKKCDLEVFTVSENQKKIFCILKKVYKLLVEFDNSFNKEMNKYLRGAINNVLLHCEDVFRYVKDLDNIKKGVY